MTVSSIFEEASVLSTRNSVRNQTVHARNFRLRYGWLYVRYDERFWYWEFVTMARKLAFVAIGLIPHKVAVWALYSSGTLLALASQLKLTPLAGRDYGGRLDSVWCLSFFFLMYGMECLYMSEGNRSKWRPFVCRPILRLFFTATIAQFFRSSTGRFVTACPALPISPRRPAHKMI